MSGNFTIYHDNMSGNKTHYLDKMSKELTLKLHHDEIRGSLKKPLKLKHSYRY